MLEKCESSNYEEPTELQPGQLVCLSRRYWDYFVVTPLLPISGFDANGMPILETSFKSRGCHVDPGEPLLLVACWEPRIEREFRNCVVLYRDQLFTTRRIWLQAYNPSSV
jgi:hypothetical protein